MANFATVFLQKVTHVDDVVVSEDFKDIDRRTPPNLSTLISHLNPREGLPRSGTGRVSSLSIIPKLDLTPLDASQNVPKSGSQQEAEASSSETGQSGPASPSNRPPSLHVESSMRERQGSYRHNTRFASSSMHHDSSNLKPVITDAKRSARRHFLSTPPDLRSDIDLHSLDESVMYGCTACATLTKGARLALARVAQIMTFEDGDNISLPGQPMSCVYFVLEGQVEAIERSSGLKTVFHDGQSLGAFLEPPSIDPKTPRTRQALKLPEVQRPRVWTVSAVATAANTECAVVTQEQWGQVIASEPHWDARKVASFLEDMPVFGPLNKAQLLVMARQCSSRSFSAGSVIYKQGSEDTEDLHIVRSGTVRLVRGVVFDNHATARINHVTSTMIAATEKLDALVSPKRELHHPLKIETLDMSFLTPSNKEEAGDSLLAPAMPSGAVTARGRLEASSSQCSAADELNATASSSELPPIESPTRHSKRPPASARNPSVQPPATARNPSVQGSAVITSQRPHGSNKGLSPVLLKPFASHSPMYLATNSGQVLVELGSLCSGRTFGACPHGQRQSSSAVAETNVMVLLISRSDVKTHMANQLASLWNQPVGPTDAALRSNLEKKMKWELYKKKIMQEVFTWKQKRTAR
ncbi:hypothetical protein CEUSTIGMA_g5411.t1 [Chlamydomonas eustigma]|uniref:Cyclic nucleotide-binding domain-containing protein n=1 Tax=Chlamydomonas eustigma TaxID=1157962 RepID=A0A250X4X5_9CHLO|nr:hypothetical protein CEUSTIGMA_g5411.t1 [Chlamydomonas eustigma]|eukprot:GAX77969.1 hypothetical protein CEUSTIGMA_g5411.t1 [Chlamydomonas eustigma]